VYIYKAAGVFSQTAFIRNPYRNQFSNLQLMYPHLLASLSILIFISCNTGKQNNNSSHDSSELLRLERTWLEAEFSLDTAFLSTLMDSTFISISDEGVKNKTNDLISMYKNIKQRQRDSIIIDSFRLDTAVVNVYGNSAVVTFIVNTFGRNKTEPRERRTRFYDVWIKRNEKWKAVSSKGTSL
jgi:hypothetical protein